LLSQHLSDKNGTQKFSAAPVSNIFSANFLSQHFEDKNGTTKNFRSAGLNPTNRGDLTEPVKFSVSHAVPAEGILQRWTHRP
jgi:hypothetical protein